jgi:hypothetical protein
LAVALTIADLGLRIDDTLTAPLIGAFFNPQSEIRNLFISFHCAREMNDNLGNVSDQRRVIA